MLKNQNSNYDHGTEFSLFDTIREIEENFDTNVTNMSHTGITENYEFYETLVFSK